MNRQRWARRLGRHIPEPIKIGCALIVLLPLILLTLPFYLPWFAWQESRRRCPLCGQRGTLQPVQLPDSEARQGYRWRRVSPERAVLNCSACGLHIRRTDLEAHRTVALPREPRIIWGMSAARPPSTPSSRHALGLALLLIVTAIWGSTFAVVKTATAELHPATLIFWRFAIGTVCLLPLFLGRLLPGRGGQESATPAGTPRRLWLDGLILGAWLIAGYGTQTIALSSTSANRAAFITALSVVLVPLWQALVARKRLAGALWGAATLAVTGLALLSWEGGRLVIGDVWALACAVTYAGFILSLERTSRWHPALPYTLAQLLWVAALALIWLLLSGAPLLPGPASWGPLLYLGAAATAVTTLCQTLGQRWVSAAEASVIYALEPVSASIFSYFLLGERVYLRGFLGGAMVVGATVLSQFGGGQVGGGQLDPDPQPEG